MGTSFFTCLCLKELNFSALLLIAMSLLFPLLRILDLTIPSGTCFFRNATYMGCCRCVCRKAEQISGIVLTSPDCKQSLCRTSSMPEVLLLGWWGLSEEKENERWRAATFATGSEHKSRFFHDCAI